MPKKLTYEFVKSQFEKDNYIPKFTEYKNNYTKLPYICPKGHEGSITWGDWGSGCRCFECFGTKKLTIEFIRDEFKKYNYILLSTEYINNHTKLNYICPNGHKHSITWNDWKAGKRCGYCAGIIEEIKPSRK